MQCSEYSYREYYTFQEAVNSFVINTGGFCKNMNNLTVEITFEPCPRGFQLAPSEDRCECDGRLDAPQIECFIDNQTIKTSGKYWFQYQNETLYVWKLCRWDYCNKNSTLVPIADVNDSQCINNRARILCGKCRDTFSMALGSSQCIECSNSHLQYAFLWLVPLFAVLGSILVLTMLATYKFNCLSWTHQWFDILCQHLINQWLD